MSVMFLICFFAGTGQVGEINSTFLVLQEFLRYLEQIQSHRSSNRFPLHFVSWLDQPDSEIPSCIITLQGQNHLFDETN